MTERALIVVAKHPSPDRTKTRLAPALGSVQAAALYECFLKDTLEVMRRVPGADRFLAFSPAEEREYFARLAPDFALIPQIGDGLGERLDNALSEPLAAGFENAVVAGSDCPTLPAAHVVRAFDLLEAADVVLGPCDDGGYYLIGLKRSQPRLLKEVEMSTPHVLRDTIALAESLGLAVALGPRCHDVDTIEDLRRLRTELDSAPETTAPHTRECLTRLEAKIAS